MPPSPPQPCWPSNLCSPGSTCTASGVCVATQGLNCRIEEDPVTCCKRSVRKGCARKGSVNRAKRNCRKAGFKRCKKRFEGL